MNPLSWSSNHIAFVAEPPQGPATSSHWNSPATPELLDESLLPSEEEGLPVSVDDELVDVLVDVLPDELVSEASWLSSSSDEGHAVRTNTTAERKRMFTELRNAK